MDGTYWTVSFSFLLGGGILFLLWALTLAATGRSLDISTHDRYVAVSPLPLLVLAAILFVAAYFVWKAGN